MRCPNCGGFVIREPAAVRCIACGRRAEVVDADEGARLRQRIIDFERRPRSAECWPDFQEIIASPSHPGRGWVGLPGAPRKNRRPPRRRVGHREPDTTMSTSVTL